jgi:DUF4097 and DUF4098 domain-containing protein YvlB
MRSRKIAKSAILTLGIVLLIGAFVGAALAREKFEEKFEKTESLAKDGKVIINNISGKIDVQVWDQAQVKVEATKVSDASSLDKAKENSAKVTIEVTKTGNIVQVETKYPEGSRSLNVSVHYLVHVPDKASVKVKSVSGGVSAASIGGTFEGSITSGSASLTKIAGAVDCRTVSGGIDVQDVGSDVDLKTVSGSITATRIKGSVEAETTSGGITLTDVSGAKAVRAKVLSGGIVYDGQIAGGGKYVLETLSGGVRVVLPANAAFELEAETFSGHVNSEFPITMSGKIGPKELRGVVNGGGASLRLKSFSGGIDIEKKK